MGPPPPSHCMRCFLSLCWDPGCLAPSYLVTPPPPTPHPAGELCLTKVATLYPGLPLLPR